MAVERRRGLVRTPEVELSLPDVLELLVTAAAVLALPGPSVLYVVARGVAAGARSAFLAALGVGIGLLAQVAVVAAGIGALLARSDAASDVVRVGGAVVLVVLGVRAYRARRALVAETRSAVPVVGRARVLRDGVVVGALNPKRLLLLVALLPQFVTTGATPVGVQLLLLGALVVATALVVDGVWGLLAGTARRWLRERERIVERLGAVAGVAMIAIGVRLALSV